MHPRRLAFSSIMPSMSTQPQSSQPIAAGEADELRCPADAGPAWQAACAAGLDMSLVEMNLQRTPWERWLAHDEALRFSLRLRKAVEEYYG